MDRFEFLSFTILFSGIGILWFGIIFEMLNVINFGLSVIIALIFIIPFTIPKRFNRWFEKPMFRKE